GLVGKVDFTVRHLSSSTTSFPSSWVFNSGQQCIGNGVHQIFGGVGIACLPLGLIFSFIRRPKAVITRSQYIKEATELGKKAKELKKAAESLHQDERSGAKGRKHRKNVKEVEKVRKCW
ncbi:LIMR family protein, partial [Trifolium medium]|nr:LIMR family protein [Trifolium medium]